jgi:hypothetical protein
MAVLSALVAGRPTRGLCYGLVGYGRRICPELHDKGGLASIDFPGRPLLSLHNNGAYSNRGSL